MARVEGGFRDVAYDPQRERWHVASQDRLKKFEGGRWTTIETPPDQFGNHRVATVAVDPVVPSVVYAGSHRDIYLAHNSVVRSVDAGVTWENLRGHAPLPPVAGRTGGNGPHEVATIRVHPVTREAWASGQCFGLWRLPPPGPGRE